MQLLEVASSGSSDAGDWTPFNEITTPLHSSKDPVTPQPIEREIQRRAYVQERREV